MRLIGVQVCRLIAIGTTGRRLNLLELWQLRQALQHIHQIWIWEVTLLQQLAQVLDGGRYRLDEVCLTLEIATEAIGSQHLQLAEQHKQAQALHEFVGSRHLRILLQRIIVLIDQLSAQFVRILRTGLPQERCQVVVVRTTTTTLEVNEIRITLSIHHYIPCLKVTIQEALLVASSCQVFRQQAEVSLQLHLVEVQLGSLQETVFKVVQVEQHRYRVEVRLWITVRKVQLTSTTQLYIRQLADGTLQQLLLLQRIATTSLTTTTDGVKQRHRTQVRLQVAQLIVRHCQHLGHRQLTLRKVLGQIDEGVILITTRTHASYHRRAVGSYQSIVLTITAGTCQLLYLLGFCPTPLLV